jgi:two-component system chemotaxis response regulator CheB
MSLQEQKPIRVLVVDDSPTAAELLTHVLNSDRRLKVVEVATDGEQAVEAARRTAPDVITMDIHMPKVNGYEATRRIMETCPAPIVIVSGSLSVKEVASNFRAIEAGALAVVQRPYGLLHPDFAAQSRELVETVKLMSEVKVVRRWARARLGSPILAPLPKPPTGLVRVVAVGASTGGPLVLQTILARLPKDLPVPVLIVQHMTPGFVEGFVEWLGRSSGFPVRVAAAGETLAPGQAYMAPDRVQMGVAPDHCVYLSPDVPENGMRPSVSYLFRSVQQVYGAHSAAVLLSGMGRDGADEMKLLRESGAVTIAQDKESSVIHGMPGEAIEIGAAVHVLPPPEIARLIANLVAKP